MNKSFYKKTIILIVVCLFDLKTSWSQHLNTNLEFRLNQLINKQINQSQEIIHSSFKPLIISYLNNKSIFDTLYFYENRDKIFSANFKTKWLYRKIRNEDFVNHQSNNFNLKINPLFNIVLKKDKESSKTYFNNTRGIEIKGDIGNHISFYSSFYENQARFEPYIADYINQYLVVPGQGAVKKIGNDKFDFSMATAYLTIKPWEKFDIQLGHSKHFIGEGYRSLLLSDNSFCYPFIKFGLSFGKFQYIVLWSQHQLFSNVYYNYHQRKYNSISYLSWVPIHGFEFSLFESVIWQGNTAEDQNKFNIGFFNPLILSKSLIYGLDNEKNVLIGINTRLKIYDFAQLFGQFVIDKTNSKVPAENNFAYQIGIKHFDLFHQKLNHQSLYLHAEYNYITPYTYTWENPLQSYTHYNQPLAHPAGTGLKETLFSLTYSFKDLYLTCRGNYLINSLDTLNSNFGSDIFQPDIVVDGIASHIGNNPGQGIQNKTVHFYSELGFLVNPATNLRIFFGIHYRESSNIIENTSNTFYSFGIKTDINNYYYDF